MKQRGFPTKSDSKEISASLDTSFEKQPTHVRKYNGVSYDTNTKKYLAQIFHDGLNHNLGRYDDFLLVFALAHGQSLTFFCSFESRYALKVDAAFGYDVCAKVLKGNLHKNINFANKTVYEAARLSEIGEKGFVVSEMEVMEVINNKVKQVKSKIANTKKTVGRIPK